MRDAKSQVNTEKYRDRLATEFATARRLHEALRDAKEFAVIKPVTYNPELFAIVSEEAPGESLANLISRKGKLWPSSDKLEQLARHCRRAGQALAAIQQATAEDSRFDPAELLEYIDLRMQRLLKSDRVPFSAVDRQQILRFLESTIPRVPVEQLGVAGSHSDYAPFNLLAAPEKITVADFTMFKTGSVYNDLTYFYHRLAGYLHKPIYRPHTIRCLQDEFLRGYMESRRNGQRAWPITEDLLFKIFWIKHVVNNYSAIMRQRVVLKGRTISLPVQLFNQYVFRRYNHWLNDFCQL
ncbi:MAG: phosphotransferase [candidate division KSB1 bacterium]|nr:phosphotransferase [candidate division KSB1 bacterium]MDZ7302288.1 phosphotransferase [candidate division KSB1 bacterium]MDZ7311394.1 phosphotransferase [candidate division KSB1 bacterium]